MIFKRKSFHLFRNVERNITPTELNKIKETFRKLKPLLIDIRTDMRIVPASETTCKRGEEYCILLYSEKKRKLFTKYWIYRRTIGFIFGFYAYW